MIGWSSTDDGFAYRCLPLNIANAHGWLILNPAPFIARWNGGSGIDAVDGAATAAGTSVVASSHFGSGVLTFNVNALFRTEAGLRSSWQPARSISPRTAFSR